MTELRCNVIHCASNKENCCCQPSIKVQGKSATTCDDTRCQSFVGKGSGEFSNATNFCQGNCSCDVACTAVNCSYNQAGGCVAQRIDINGCGATEMSQTKCSSFQKK